MLASRTRSHTFPSFAPETPVLSASNVADSTSRLLRWRMLVYLLLLAAAVVLASAERFHPTPAPTISASPDLDPD